MNDSQINFLVKNEGKSIPYTAEVIIKDNHMFIHCNCPAGKFGKFCGHKISLTQDDHDILYDQAQRNDLNRIADWIQNSDFVEFIFERSQFKKQLRAAEDRLEAVKRDMKPVEDKMAQAMKNGIKSVLR